VMLSERNTKNRCPVLRCSLLIRLCVMTRESVSSQRNRVVALLAVVPPAVVKPAAPSHHPGDKSWKS
jgi:hypothetical protein